MISYIYIAGNFYAEQIFESKAVNAKLKLEETPMHRVHTLFCTCKACIVFYNERKYYKSGNFLWRLSTLEPFSTSKNFTLLRYMHATCYIRIVGGMSANMQT